MLTVATPSLKLSASSWKGRLRPARSNNGQHAHPSPAAGRAAVGSDLPSAATAVPATPDSGCRHPADSPAPGSAAPQARLRGWYRRFWSALEGTGKSRNGSTYYLILGSTLALTAIGIMMVLSASSVEAIAAGESPYTAALKQGMFAAIGVFCMFLLSRVNVVWLKRLAWLAHHRRLRPAGAGAPGGPQRQRQPELDRHRRLFTFQPSEAAKLALALWMATVLAKKAKLLHQWQHAVVPVVPLARRRSSAWSWPETTSARP